jgi:hypothetical protein
MFKVRAVIVSAFLAVGLPLGVVASIATTSAVPQASGQVAPLYFVHG